MLARPVVRHQGLGCPLLLACWLVASVCSAQDFAVLTELATDEQAVQRPFQLPQHSPDTIEALEDFQRFVRREAWDRALELLETVRSQDAAKLFTTQSGLLLPTRDFVQRRLTTLPPAGKRAYRVFHDAEAKALFEAAAGEKETSNLQELVASYLITSVGDLAADRLGDLLFETGEFERAATNWKLILDYCPESSLPRASILAKRSIALARSGRWDEFATALSEIKERHPKEEVTLGGNSVVASEYLEQLAAAAPAKRDSSASTSLPPDAVLPDEVAGEKIAPLWQFWLYGEATGNQTIQLHDRWGRQSPSRMVVPTDVDQQRLYGNVMGYLFALDLVTGKLLWRTGDFDHLPTELRNNYYVFPDRYRVKIDGTRLWAVTNDPQQRNNSDNPEFSLVALDPASGKVVIDSKNITSLKDWSFLGTPLCREQQIFACATKTNTPNELYLLALNVTNKTLAEAWAIAVGTYHSEGNFRGIGKSPQPILLSQGSHLFVDTQAGALVRIHAEAGRLVWGLYYDTPPTQAGNRFFWNQPLPLLTETRPFISDGILYVKGMRSRQVNALRIDPTQVAWQRPIDQASIVVGCDSERMYVGGPEMAAYDLTHRNRRLVWSQRMPMETDYVRPLMTRERLYQYTHRGIFEVNKQDGKILRLFRGADRDSVGGVLHLTDQAMVTVSDRAVTAYALAEDPTHPPQSGG